MIAAPIKEIPYFADDTSEYVFKDIEVIKQGLVKSYDDNSILAVMRALLFTRNDEHRKYKYIEYGVDCGRNISIDHENALILVGNNGYDNTEFSKWTELTNESKFIEAHTNDKVRIYTGQHNSTVIIGKFTNNNRHAIASLVPRYFNELFAQKKIDVFEKNILVALGKNISDFIVALEEFAQEHNIAAQVNAIKLRQASKLYRNRRVKTLENEWKIANRNVEDSFETYKRFLREKEDAITKLEGARAQLEAADEDDVLESFIRSNKNIDIAEVKSGEIDIIITNYLDSYDADGFEGFGDPFYSNLYDYLRAPYVENKEDLKLLLTAIFSNDPQYRIRTRGYYELHLEGYVETKRGYAFPPKYNNRVTNPHLDYHSCLGGYERLINEKMQKNDLVGALAQCNGSVMSINVHETGPTFIPFISRLINENKAVIERVSDKQVLTAEQVLKELKEAKAE